jgi:hypothetical protein
MYSEILNLLLSHNVRPHHVSLDGLVVIVLAIGHKVRVLKFGWRQWIFKGDKNL